VTKVLRVLKVPVEKMDALDLLAQPVFPELLV